MNTWRFAILGSLLGAWLVCFGAQRVTFAERAPMRPSSPRFPHRLRTGDAISSYRARSVQLPAVHSTSLGLYFAACDAEQHIASVLEKPNRLGSNVEATLDVLVDDVHRLYGINCEVDVRALEEASILSTDFVVKLSKHDGTLGGALERILASIEGLALSIAHETLWITSSEQAEKTLLLVVYDVTDLVRVNAHDDNSDELWDAIVNLVESDSWKENGTGEGDAAIYDHESHKLLLVSNCLAVQTKLRIALESLRDAAGLPSSSEPQYVRASAAIVHDDQGRSETIRPARRARKYVKVSQ